MADRKAIFSNALDAWLRGLRVMTSLQAGRNPHTRPDRASRILRRSASDVDLINRDRSDRRRRFPAYRVDFCRTAGSLSKAARRTGFQSVGGYWLCPCVGPADDDGIALAVCDRPLKNSAEIKL
jgi:hypothetical protein